MIRITRVTDIEDLKDMIPHLTLMDGSEFDFVRSMAEMIVQRPDSALVLQARTEDEERSLCGFVVVQNPGLLYPYVWMSQVWVDAKSSKVVSDDLLVRVFLWAVSIGKTSIRGQVERDPSAIHRRFGFSVRGYIVEKQIDPSMMKQFIEVSKEIVHA